jgi:hypothetical protein
MGSTGELLRGISELGGKQRHNPGRIKYKRKKKKAGR